MWSPDGRTIAYASSGAGVQGLVKKAASGAGAAEMILATQQVKLPEDWSSDGRYLLYRTTDAKTGRDLWAFPMDGKSPPFIVHQTEFEERDSQFSPDVRWVAYDSNQSGVFEVYVQQFRGSGSTWQVSTGGGVQPRWRRDGKELFYVALDGRLMSVPIALTPDGQALQPGNRFRSSRHASRAARRPAAPSISTPWRPTDNGS